MPRPVCHNTHRRHSHKGLHCVGNTGAYVHENIIVVSDERFQARKEKIACFDFHFAQFRHAESGGQHVKSRWFTPCTAILQIALRGDPQQYVQIGSSRLQSISRVFKASSVQNDGALFLAYIAFLRESAS